MRIKHLGFFAAALCFIAPLSASAATTSTFEVSGWMPYWSVASSTKDVSAHLNEMTEVDPFSYAVTNSGALQDDADMASSTWTTFIAQAHADGVRVVPTVMWSNPTAMHTILSNTTSRIALEDSITALVKQNNYDGVDIDFEGLQAADSNYFSTFLMGLYERMGQKWVMCDVPPRTPLSQEYYGETVPTGAGTYAYNYTALNEYCDRVRLMTYDQQGADQFLADTAASSSELYAPVSDPAWIESVVSLAEQYISPSKIEIGIPTYGYEYQVTAYANNDYDYDILWTFDPGYATQIEQQYNVAPTRAPWGEEELTYTPTNGTTTAPTSAVSTAPYSALVAASAASLYATTFNSHLTFNLLVWPDAQTIKNDVALAKALGVRGVAIFKLDGDEDPGMWAALQGAKQ